MRKSEKGISTNRMLLLLAILAGIFGTAFIVYLSGGTEFAFTHLMYLPIILAAFVFGMKGAELSSLLGGFLLGPIMPVDVSAGIMQTPGSWMFRMFAFLASGATMALLFRRMKRDDETRVKKSYTNTTTGLPNASKLKFDMSKMINEKEDFCVIVFKIINFDNVNRYIDYSVGEKALFKTIAIMNAFFEKNNIYSVFTNEFALILPGCDIGAARIKAREFLDCFEEPIHIEGLPVDLAIKCGITNYPMHSGETNDLFKKMGRTLDQQKFNHEQLSIYDHSISEKNKAKYETLISLYDAIKDSQFSLVYQPIIDLKNNEVMSAEALLRWNNSEEMSPAEFIKIAEDAAIISEITKWVIRNVIDQLKEWKKEGLKAKVAVNISSKDLKDDSIIDFATDYLEVSGIEPWQLEFELTERGIIENENKVEHLLSCIKDIGMKSSLDDFGTGYNSLIQLVKLPIDYLKIDKYFIDNIDSIQHRYLIEEIIHLAHSLGKQVIAEGVETKEQFDILTALNCDNIQGYYFSKPMPSERFKAFTIDFNQKGVSGKALSNLTG